MEIDPLKQQATVKSQEDTRAAAEANLKFAQQQYERSQRALRGGRRQQAGLRPGQVGARQRAKRQVQALDANVREQQVQLHYYKVTAPSSGIVGDIPVHVGDRVTTSTVLTTVDKPGRLEVYVYVPIERAAQLKMNMPVQVLDGSGQRDRGQPCQLHFSAGRQHDPDHSGEGAHREQPGQAAAVAIHSSARDLGNTEKPSGAGAGRIANRRTVFCVYCGTGRQGGTWRARNR